MKKKLLIALLALGLAVTFGSSWAAGSTKLDGVINMNTATAEELMLLPGVGEVKAKMIITARTAKPFAGREDLLSVKGIGEKLIEKWNTYLVFDGKTSLKEIE